MEVEAYDFIDKELGKVTPYGAYDITNNLGWVNVGTDNDTAQFAVKSIQRWWEELGEWMYPDAEEIMKTIKLQDIKKEKMTMEGAEKVFKQIPISKADGSPSFCFRVFTIEPGGHTPYHTHDFEHLNHVISGQGVLVNEQGEHLSLKAGEFAIVLPNEKHQFRNASDNEPFVIICAVPNEYE